MRIHFEGIRFGSRENSFFFVTFVQITKLFTIVFLRGIFRAPKVMIGDNMFLYIDLYYLKMYVSKALTCTT